MTTYFEVKLNIITDVWITHCFKAEGKGKNSDFTKAIEDFLENNGYKGRYEIIRSYTE